MGDTTTSRGKFRGCLTFGALIVCFILIVIFFDFQSEQTTMTFVGSSKLSNLRKDESRLADEMVMEDADEVSVVLPYPRKKYLARFATRTPTEHDHETPTSLAEDSEEETIQDPAFVDFVNVNQTKRRDNPLVSIRHRFVCLKDDRDLWRQRKIQAANVTNNYCRGETLGPLGSVTRSVPVIFVLEQKYRDAAARIHLLTLAANTAAKFNDRVYVLIFGPDIWDLWQLRPFSKNVRVYNFQDRNHPVYKAYLGFDDRIYVHRSSNAYTYEIVCFQRWFGLQKFVEIQKIEMAFVIDYDVLLFTNVTQEMEQCYRGCTFGAARATGTFTSYFSAGALKEFVRFIHRFYRERMYEKAKQVSDMLVFDTFVNDYWSRNPGSEACFDETVSDTRWKPRAFPRRAATFDNMIFRNDRRSFYQDPLGLPFMFGVGGYEHYYPLKSLHFQGNDKHDLFNCKCLSDRPKQ